MRRFLSQASQFVDKTQHILYRHLIAVTQAQEAKEKVKQRGMEIRSHKLDRNWKKYPLEMLYGLNTINRDLQDQLYDFSKMTMHGPMWEERLEKIRQVRLETNILDRHGGTL